MSEVKFVDTTLRDGQASLWAENMRTGMMLVVADRIDNAGFQAIELIASSHIKKCVRELREDPFERMRLVAKKITRTPLRAIGSERLSAFELTPDAVNDLWFERMVANGIKQLATIKRAVRKNIITCHRFDRKRAGLPHVLTRSEVLYVRMNDANFRSLFHESHCPFEHCRVEFIVGIQRQNVFPSPGADASIASG